MSIPIFFHTIFMCIALILTITSVIVVALKFEKKRIKTHKLLNTLALISTLVGFTWIALYKQQNNYPHFISTHSKLGIITLVLFILSFITGTLLLKGRTSVKNPHKIVGIIVISLLTITSFFGFRMIRDY